MIDPTRPDPECILDECRFFDGDDVGYALVCLNSDHRDRECPLEGEMFRLPRDAARTALHQDNPQGGCVKDDELEQMLRRMRSEIDKGEGPGIEQRLVRAWVDMGRVIPDFTAAAQGLLDAQRGISAARYDSSRSGGFQQDDGLPIDSPGGPAVIPPPDEATAARRDLFRSAMAAVNAIVRMRDLILLNARLGLPMGDPRRAPTKDERRSAADEAIEEKNDLCRNHERHGKVAYCDGRYKDLCRQCGDFLHAEHVHAPLQILEWWENRTPVTPARRAQALAARPKGKKARQAAQTKETAA